MAESKLDAGPGSNKKDDLVPQTPMQHDPYRARAADFPVSHVDAKTGQSGERGKAEGGDQLASQSVNQCGPRYLEDSGPGSGGSGTPTGWESGGRSAKIASAFPIGTGAEAGTSVSISERVNFKTGMIEADGYKPTRVKETPEKKVSIPSA